MMNPNNKSPVTLFSPKLLAAAAALAMIGGAASLYLTQASKGKDGNTPINANCTEAAQMASKLSPLMKGEIAALQPGKLAQSLPPLTFNDPHGKPLTLTDFKGKTIMLNLWATWCAPCKAEMPALDKLQQSQGSEHFEVVAVNIDTRNIEKPQQFLKEIGVSALKNYTDATGKIFIDLKGAGKAFGMPTTILIDKKGCEIANLAGPADWNSEDAHRLIKTLLVDAKK